MPRRSRTTAVAALAALAALLVAHGVAGADIVANVADDVCDPAADPCVISTGVDLQPGAVLDFGTRAVQVTGTGKLNLASGSAVLRCGDLVLGGQGATAVGSGFASPTLTLEAYRSCSADTAQRCLGDVDCDLGICRNVCSNDSSISCSSSANCPASAPCTGATACSRSTARACSSNADCNAGLCAAGSGTLSVNATIVGRAESPATVYLSAAGDLVTSAAIDLSGSKIDSDGGEIGFDSGTGSVTIGGKVSVGSGGQGYGGSVDITAFADVRTNAELDANGGDGDGGYVSIDAGRDVFITKTIAVNALSGEGWGGEIEAYSGRDLVVTGSSGNRTILGADAHKTLYYGGDGGSVTLSAEAMLDFGQYAKVSADGKLDGAGGDVWLDAGTLISIDGDIDAMGTGLEGGGGALEVDSGGPGSIGPTALLRLTGGADDGGSFDMSSGGDFEFAGAVDVTAVNGGSGGDVSVDVDGDLSLSGTVSTNGDVAGIDITGCRIHLESSGVVSNLAIDGENWLTARESMTLAAGSQLRADQASGTNLLIYRDAAKPPQRSGTEVPVAELLLNPDLYGCPVCGNAEIDQDETCDDGGLVAGDGCNEQCQSEACIAETPGYPATSLCDDNDECTVDSCSIAGNGCLHDAVPGCGVSTTTTNTTTTVSITTTTELVTTSTQPVTTTTTIPGEVILCGDATGDGSILTVDALAILQAAVAKTYCDPRRCDIDNSGSVLTTDALAVLRKAVGIPQELNCPLVLSLLWP